MSLWYGTLMRKFDVMLWHVAGMVFSWEESRCGFGG